MDLKDVPTSPGVFMSPSSTGQRVPSPDLDRTVLSRETSTASPSWLGLNRIGPWHVSVLVVLRGKHLG